MIYTVLLSLAWTFSYVYRVGTKDMTYTKQLKVAPLQESHDPLIRGVVTPLDTPGKGVATPLDCVSRWRGPSRTCTALAPRT